MLIVSLLAIVAIPLAVSWLRTRGEYDPSARSLAALMTVSMALMQIHYIVIENAFDIFEGSVTHPFGDVPIVASVGVLIVAADEYRRMDEAI